MQTESFKPNVLYVDDEQDNLLVFKSSFRRNYNIQTASSAQEGLDLLKENSFEMVISDQNMPGMTGVEFLKNLPDDRECVRMILTGFSDIGAVIDALNTGKIQKYVTKPWEKEELQPVIDDALRTLSKTKNEKEQIASERKERKILEDAIQGGASKNDDGSLLKVIKLEEENKELKKQVEDSYKNVHLLSEIGQEIISNLTIDSIIENTYENVNALMDATIFGIGIYDIENNRINFLGSYEKGTKLPVGFVSIKEDKPAVWTLKNKTEFFSNDYKTDFTKYSKSKLTAVVGDLPESMIYLPMIIKDTAIGVITVQSFKKDAYTPYHLNVFKNISLLVASALENAKTYSLIEEQKEEIEHKNVELENKVEHRTQQLQQKNEEVEKQRDQLESTFNNVKLLSEIGQQITSTLSLEKIIETVYENVNQLMDATVFGIGVFNADDNRIDFPVSIEKGVKLSTWFSSLDEDNRLPTWCFKNQKEIIINDYQTEYNKYVKSIQKPKTGENPESILYLPLMTSEGPIGVITVQSFRKHIYTTYHIDILRSLGTYITIAIQNANSYRKMTEAFEQLKSTQSKLVESEKMASLGVLTAGVAHEINNPVNFISAGIKSLKENYTDLEDLLKLYLNLDRKKISEAQWDEIDELKAELEIESLLPEIEELFGSIRNGATRTAEIVKGLRNFSRLDEGDMKKANLEEGIDNTLVILNNRLKNRVKVTKEYSKLPEVVCYPGQLNQVFMNIIYNATDAIEGEGEINIKTGQDNGNIKISIKDSGKGMTEDVRSRIFEPFFTTKAVGKGTGLGLSISYGIIEKHKGSIDVKSEAGKGTEFIITLPLNNF